MNEQFQEAFSLMGVGMLTVFIILLVVVLVGNSIISFVNRFFPDTDSLSGNGSKQETETNASKTAAIVAAVKIVTGGRAKVVRIEKQ